LQTLVVQNECFTFRTIEAGKGMRISPLTKMSGKVWLKFLGRIDLKIPDEEDLENFRDHLATTTQEK